MSFNPYRIHTLPRTRKALRAFTAKAVADFLAKGGTITKCPAPRYRGGKVQAHPLHVR